MNPMWFCIGITFGVIIGNISLGILIGIICGIIFADKNDCEDRL